MMQQTLLFLLLMVTVRYYCNAARSFFCLFDTAGVHTEPDLN